MEEKKNKKLKVLIIVGIVLVLVSGVTLAYFMSRRTGTPTTVEAKDLAITYTNENKFNIDSKIAPIMEGDILTSAPKVEFTVTNTGEDNVYLQFDIVDITLSKFKDYDFKWALYQGETKITTGSFIAEEDSELTLAAGKELAPSTPTTYQVYVWINETGNDQSDMMAGTFTGTVQVTGYGKDNTLARKILTSGTKYATGATYKYYGCDPNCVAAVGEEKCYEALNCSSRELVSIEYSGLDTTIYTTPTFSESSTDRGLFLQQGDSAKSDFGFPTYYYKGQNDNNYVSFGGREWRIVRINEDGSIRLINTSGTGSIQYDNTDPYPADYSGSNLESKINTWYNNNIGSSSGTTLDNLVQTGNFCNDISKSYTAAQTRMTNNNPTFTCPNDGVIINSKVGIITVDEAMYAGMSQSENANNTSYIYIYNVCHTMTPYSNDQIYQLGVGRIYKGDMYDAAPLAFPVINLKPDVTVKSGDGTSTSPYIIG